MVGSNGIISNDISHGRSTVRSTQIGPNTTTRENSFFFSSRRPDDGGRRITRPGAIGSVQPGIGHVPVGSGQVPVVASSRDGIIRAERHGGSTYGFYRDGMDRRIQYPGVPVPRAGGVSLNFFHHRSYVHGRTFIVGVPERSCGFGFFTPVPVYPYPVYPYPIYSSTTIINPPGYADGGYYADNSYYPDSAYGAEPPPDYATARYADQGGPYADMPPQGVAGPSMEEDSTQPPMPAPENAESGQPMPEGNAAPRPVAPGNDTANAAPTRAQQLMRDGLDAFTAGDYDKAGRTFLQVAMGDHNNIDAWLAYAVARFATRDYEASALAIRRGVGGMPDVVNSPIDLRDRYGNKTDFDRQLSMLEEHLRATPESADGWLVLGFVRHFSGQRELASKTFGVIQRRFEGDRDLAKTFLEAKTPAELERQTAPGEGSPGSVPPSPGSENQGAAPGVPSSGAASANPVQNAVRSEGALRESGLIAPLDE